MTANEIKTLTLLTYTVEQLGHHVDIDAPRFSSIGDGGEEQLEANLNRKWCCRPEGILQTSKIWASSSVV